MDKIYELKEMLCDELEEYADKGKIDVGGLDAVDKLAHAVKNLGKIIEMSEEEYSGAYEGGGSYERGGYSRRMGGSYRGGSYARGRGRNANRDSMGRYSNENYSMAADDISERLRDLMHDAPDEKTKMDIGRLIDKMDKIK